MVAGHPFDVSKSLLSGSDQLRSALLQSPLILVLLVEPANQDCSLRLDHFGFFLVCTQLLILIVEPANQNRSSRLDDFSVFWFLLVLLNHH